MQLWIIYGPMTSPLGESNALASAPQGTYAHADHCTTGDLYFADLHSGLLIEAYAHSDTVLASIVWANQVQVSGRNVAYYSYY